MGRFWIKFYTWTDILLIAFLFLDLVDEFAAIVAIVVDLFWSCLISSSYTPASAWLLFLFLSRLVQSVALDNFSGSDMQVVVAADDLRDRRCG